MVPLVSVRDSGGTPELDGGRPGQGSSRASTPTQGPTDGKIKSGGWRVSERSSKSSPGGGGLVVAAAKHVPQGAIFQFTLPGADGGGSCHHWKRMNRGLKPRGMTRGTTPCLFRSSTDDWEIGCVMRQRIYVLSSIRPEAWSRSRLGQNRPLPQKQAAPMRRAGSYSTRQNARGARAGWNFSGPWFEIGHSEMPGPYSLAVSGGHLMSVQGNNKKSGKAIEFHDQGHCARPPRGNNA